MQPEPKSCASCGREITWRKKWANNWDEVKYCSDKCRRSKVSSVDLSLEHAISDLLDRTKVDGTICPSDAAKRVGGEDWRPLMELSRAAARRMVTRDEVEITQKGSVVDPSHAKGPIRIRRKR